MGFQKDPRLFGFWWESAARALAYGARTGYPMTSDDWVAVEELKLSHHSMDM